MTSASPISSYCAQKLPSSVLQELEAGAFQSLCHHLQERSDSVQNLDLMTLSGFCRNCLAKWMVKSARQMVDDTSRHLSPDTVQALNQMGYAEAAEHVYGISYDEWKKRHQRKATEEQMQKYGASAALHAQHDTALLEKRDMPLASNVCCQDVDESKSGPPLTPPQQPKQASTAPQPEDRTIPPFIPPPIPFQYLPEPLHVAVLTVSDRASQGTYVTGDLSGPAVVEAVQEVLQNNSLCEVTSAIVPDDTERIQAHLNSWKDQVHLILTTGGTGFSSRDVTPEATKRVLDTELPGLMAFVTTECSRLQPLASLSRGTAGILGTSTVVANLPGNPKGVQEMIPVLLPLLLNMVVELQE
ncbi:molybdopterin adenylyltransferase [Fistulifera solaris]|uniref:molybdopterin molybdotransferase n=1 Tax=Fistulifera solaris TaxID=1519565 RepID=A0A1Z5JF18_FISSO|nr:molybdopterin adenylyltransferase [Fistulifera solaris]|eukprot:GAX12603.1 molybdopterin adenylyltransferase [Fistulifera solaris]